MAVFKLKDVCHKNQLKHFLPSLFSPPTDCLNSHIKNYEFVDYYFLLIQNSAV